MDRALRVVLGIGLGIAGILVHGHPYLGWGAWNRRSFGNSEGHLWYMTLCFCAYYVSIGSAKAPQLVERETPGSAGEAVGV